MLRASIKSRFALLTVGRLVLGAAALYRAVQLYPSSSEFHAPLASLAFFALGLVLLWWAVQGLLALLRSTSTVNESLIRESVAEIDSQAPSGLKPLWVALGLIVVALVLLGIWRRLF